MAMDLDNIKKSEITGFVAEVFYDELMFILKDSKDSNVWIQNHGMNSRAFSKDVLDLTSYDPLSMMPQANTVFIHLSRNSIYHQLPEILFHPLVISTPSMSNKEVVEAIRENRKKEEENIHFFMPFDTFLFEEKLRLSNRHFNIFTDDYAKENLFSFAKAIIKKDIPLQKEQLYKLFLNLCNSEQLKENLPELENLLRSILGFSVVLKYQLCVIEESPFLALGEGILGYDIGTQGPVISEQDNINAVMLLEESQEYKELQKNKSIIKKILEFFTFSNREIIVEHRIMYTNEFQLGTNYLGYDTVLAESKKKVKKVKIKEQREIILSV
ncbi:hypothetical protein [Tenacibaculum finnmarkense]|uniref:Uncharacterized protein n=1 Tax=Tenacibaculum finnmarkense genomovar finnmarkense TaxID=1458503 RepID=A0AAP1RH65_9FLAO|nr:hypothetical protein [Tenacibaculum finnmarkense]MBE7653846.1 hypothetical protein [Tenacibaculum finnmarkense genomovar finnmarkense]MBE7696150.1 hypothetical protein [Tenacibaculum finnmarkense genomovar finnmarkense]MCD8428329.1 hypothetical protein [Tenacibaculum finnmarkense genomovar finnmarkense]MCD8440715.1 hypothetical protein [Tenacibaculum finnmarkense genomovar ulcerans]MCG8721588.1 hypothetical protein [Tenacibaculum finnmarkense]